MSGKRFESVWQDAANMRLRSALMMALQKYVNEQKLTQNDAAALFGVSQPRVSDLMRGKIDLFSIDTLVNMAAAAKIDISIRTRKAG